MLLRIFALLLSLAISWLTVSSQTRAASPGGPEPAAIAAPGYAFTETPVPGFYIASSAWSPLDPAPYSAAGGGGDAAVNDAYLVLAVDADGLYSDRQPRVAEFDFDLIAP
ncbi:MAG TPA: hypothetical protein EYH29_00950 [Caldilineales bacterium]|nr:hypothetical protein [Caldilineales bacterium]